MKTFRTLFPILGVVTALAGCGGEDGPSDRAASALQAPGAPDADAEAAAADDERGRPPVRRHHGGLDFLVMAALHEDINLTGAQRSTIEALAPQKRPSHRPPRDNAHGVALATAIRAGKIDVTALQKHPNDTAMKQRIAASANALATLHKTLIPEQRVALVDAVVAKHAAGPKARGGKPHGERRGGGELERGPRGRGGPGGMRGPMGLLEDIGVTEAQRTQIEAKLDAQRPSVANREAKHEAMKAHFETMKKEREAELQTFKQASFDAAAFVTPPADAEKIGPRAHGDRMLTHLAVIVPLLTPEQREKLAQKIEQ